VKDLVEPREASRFLRRNNRAFGSLPSQTEPLGAFFTAIYRDHLHYPVAFFPKQRHVKVAKSQVGPGMGQSEKLKGHIRIQSIEFQI